MTKPSSNVRNDNFRSDKIALLCLKSVIACIGTNMCHTGLVRTIVFIPSSQNWRSSLTPPSWDLTLALLYRNYQWKKGVTGRWVRNAKQPWVRPNAFPNSRAFPASKPYTCEDRRITPESNKRSQNQMFVYMYKWWLFAKQITQLFANNMCKPEERKGFEILFFDSPDMLLCAACRATHHTGLGSGPAAWLTAARIILF